MMFLIFFNEVSDELDGDIVSDAAAALLDRLPNPKREERDSETLRW